MRREYDCIVVGVGGMGSAAVYRLADRGVDTLGLERFDVPHARGSSHGSTRIVRLTQPEDPSYVPLARAAFDNWRELEAATGRDLLTTTGSIHAGHPDADIVPDARASLDEHDVGYELLSGEEVSERFPGYDLPAEYRAVFQPDGGFVDCERAVSAHVEAAHAEGATVRARERVTDWRETPDGVRVETTKASYLAEDLVVAAGAWNGDLLPSLADRLTPVRRVMAWLQPERPADFQPDTFPVFSLQGREGYAYGFPTYDVPGFKFGREPDPDEPFGAADPVDPDGWNRDPTPRDEAFHREFAETYFPAGAGPTLRLRTCMLTESHDGHFLLGPHPEYDSVHVAAGFTGHGFKFTSVVGEVLADFVVDGETDHSVDLHRTSRLVETERTADD
ncbi:N-methyl-L-tryptophan oxidase [Candidatus Halobonum tyrrellensis]|uniref:N-methyltryptophan oxidase n=1 Tax=Candidatus Halobonum tyrrellensis G22 TaxID=1324957 RepID=V4H8Y2_9EURY|nr:N-methyl-L-tryptophan oxidase [Candidatus Halobonum tyrrellensis]ESP87175.1 N-methyltryptophan oxidase [Candidatus Halobonum tyrrellensis G22]